MEGYEFTLLSFSLLVFANQSSATNCWLTTPRRLHHPPSGPASPQVDSFSGLLRLLGELVTFVVGLLGELITSHSPHQVIDIPELSGTTMITKICDTETWMGMRRIGPKKRLQWHLNEMDGHNIIDICEGKSI